MNEENNQEAEIPKWRRVLQKPSDVVEDVYIPKGLVVNKELYAQGYWHGMKSTALIDFRYSFRLGFRAAMIERRQTQELKASKIQIKSIYD
jgi:hypothetical protein